MNKLLPLTVLLISLGLATPLVAQTPVAPKTDKEKLGYALGVDVGSTLKKQPFEFDKDFFLAAVRDALTGGPTQMTPEQTQEVLADFAAKMRAKQGAAGGGQEAPADPAAVAKNKAAGVAFLAENKGKSGVQTLPDGMQYKVVKDGSGPSPKATDTVTVRYRGTLINGTVFDASDKHPGPGTASFPLNRVIPGWTEAVQKMKVGSKWELYIPSDLAYGDSGMPPDIEPGSTLIFNVELVSIGK